MEWGKTLLQMETNMNKHKMGLMDCTKWDAKIYHDISIITIHMKLPVKLYIMRFDIKAKIRYDRFQLKKHS